MIALHNFEIIDKTLDNLLYAIGETSSPKGNDRLPESQQVYTIFEIVFK